MDEIGLVVTVTLAIAGGLGVFAFKQPRIFSDWQWRMLLVEGVVVVALYAFITGVSVGISALTVGVDHTPITWPVGLWALAATGLVYVTLLLSVISDRIVRDQSANDRDRP